MGTSEDIDTFIAHWAATGGDEMANSQSFINGLCALIGVEAPHGSKANSALNDYVFEHRVFQDNGDGTTSFGRIDAYKRGSFILEAKQGSESDRAHANQGDADLDLFGQTAAARIKRGTARRGTPGWAKAMVQAKGQAERYAKALPVDHGWPPFLLVTDIGYCIEVYADFTGTGKAYAQFPDRASFRIMLDDLRDPDVRARLKAIWEAPKSLDPATIAAKATREIADLLATLARRLEARGHNAEAVSAFLMRLLFTMFAEDTGLIPPRSFSDLLASTRAHPENLHHQLTALWTAMDAGDFAPALGAKLRRFNGYLFKDRTAIPLLAEELDVLIEASKADWTQVEPAIFGTLLERALDSKERAKLGAHYTPRAYVERLVMPTVIEPLRADWNGVRGAAAQIIDAGTDAAGNTDPKARDAARATVEAFHAQLAGTKVLDPACGTGNFLYVAMARMKELEGEVIELLTELGDTQYVAELSGHTITPENFLGIEINPRAAAIAQLVLWIGYLQWHFRVAGKDRMPAEPILKDIRTIENRDALIEYDSKVLARDDAGAILSRWDGETMKPHPATGKPVPDEAARVEVYRYINPRPAKWPKADFIVGNPPFIGNKRMRDRLGDGYTDALRQLTDDVPGSADFVMYWWARAARLSTAGRIRRFGFIATNSLTQAFNRQVVAAFNKVSLVYAIPDHPWIEASDGAGVRISITVAERDIGSMAMLQTVDAEMPANDGSGEVVVTFNSYLADRINPDLTVGLDVRAAKKLKANEGVAFTGMYPLGAGFIIERSSALALQVLATDATRFLKPFRTARDLAGRPRNHLIIDFYPASEAEARVEAPDLYQWVLHSVKPERDVNPVAERRRNWWLFTRPIPDLRMAVSTESRYIAVPRTAKHLTFQFVESSVIVDTTVVAIALSDALALGILSGTIHKVWARETGGTLEDRPRYQHESTFKPFPFPADVSESLKDQIRAEAEALDALRKQVLAAHDDLTLTSLYNVLDALRAGRAPTPKERDIHVRGLVTLIRQHHDAIDVLVAEAYGWGADWAAGKLDDAEILTRLVALNKARAAEEAKGKVRWLRPAFQAPSAAPEVSERLDLGEPVSAPHSAVIIPWPKTLPEQVSAVAGLLASAPVPLSPQEVARAFATKRATTVAPVLDALTAIGMARKLADGRYAA